MWFPSNSPKGVAIGGFPGFPGLHASLQTQNASFLAPSGLAKRAVHEERNVSRSIDNPVRAFRSNGQEEIGSLISIIMNLAGCDAPCVKLARRAGRSRTMPI